MVVRGGKHRYHQKTHSQRGGTSHCMLALSWRLSGCCPHNRHHSVILACPYHAQAKAWGCLKDSMATLWPCKPPLTSGKPSRSERSKSSGFPLFERIWLAMNTPCGSRRWHGMHCESKVVWLCAPALARCQESLKGCCREFFK